MSNITIRPAQPEDAREMLAYLRCIGGETDNLTFGAEGLPITEEQEQAYIRSVLDNPRAIMLTAWDGDRIVADASISPLPRRMCHRGEVGISVVKSHWRRGIATRLMEALISFAREAGFEILNLEVRSDNAPARRLYEKFGFRYIGTSPDFFKIGDTYASFELMYLDLRQQCTSQILISSKKSCSIDKCSHSVYNTSV